ncbi:hypothetical protein C8R43DRAFT_952421 [Mycena crocata]|nr:hypothetical protein C8R43DRAFT_952421 [Mycena crocata]
MATATSPKRLLNMELGALGLSVRLGYNPKDVAGGLGEYATEMSGSVDLGPDVIPDLSGGHLVLDENLAKISEDPAGRPESFKLSVDVNHESKGNIFCFGTTKFIAGVPCESLFVFPSEGWPKQGRSQRVERDDIIGKAKKNMLQKAPKN